MHNYFAKLYEIECASQHYHRTLENINIWDITASQIKDQPASTGDTIEDTELVLTTLNGFLSSWDVFVQGICAR